MGVYENNIVPIKIAHLAEYIAKVKRISLDEALVYIYLNPMYDKLYDENAKWWYLSTESLYEEFELCRHKQKLQVTKEAFEFFAYCLERYALDRRISGLRAWLDFKESGADDYILDNYDLLHTQGIEYILEEINRYITQRKK